jgi:hypothetical protein
VGNVTIFLIVAAICIGMGVLCGMLARERGRRFWAWFMPGCILWPVAHVAVCANTGKSDAERAGIHPKDAHPTVKTVKSSDDQAPGQAQESDPTA